MSRTGTGQTPPEKIRTGRPKHWSRHSPEGPWDYVVIGSGMGGLTAAAMLAKLGRRVLVLEQHYVPGGFTHAFTRKGYTWDVGVHAIGEVTQHSFPGRLLHRLTDGRLRWGSLGSVYEEFHFPDLRIDFPDSPQAFRNNLVAAFPDEEEAIDRYLALVREVSGGMRSYYLGRAVPRWLGPVGKLMERSAQEHLNVDVRTVIDGLTDDPRLRAVLTAQWGYYGVSPSRASFAVQALVAKHYLHGGFYPVGGSSSIARELTRTVEDCGGWTRILADVEEILVRGGRAVGVRLVGGEEILARRVVSAAGVLATVERMLPASVTEKTWAASARRLTPGPAHVCLYLGFKGDIAREGASGANKWFYGTWSQEGEEAWRVDGPEIGPAPVLYCSFPSMKDPEHDPGPEVRHTGEVVTFVPWETFAPWSGKPWRKRGADYDALKAKIEASLLEQFLGHMPGLAPMLDHVELSTPVSTDHFCRPMAGSIYGLEPTPERFANPWLRPRSPVRNLYFAGSEVAMVGVIGAMMGGVLGAVAAEPARSLRYLKPVAGRPASPPSPP